MVDIRAILAKMSLALHGFNAVLMSPVFGRLEPAELAAWILAEPPAPLLSF
jgi:hypothetical protein